MMRLLFILELYHPHIGGNERLFRSLAESLVIRGHKVTVLTTKFKKGLPGKEMLGGVEIIRLPVFNRFLFTFLSTIPAIMLARKADIIHTTSYNAALPARIAAKLRRKKSLITFHEVWSRLWFSLPFMSYCERAAYYLYEQIILRLKFDRFVAVSDYTKECLLQNKVSPGRILRIYNGLDYSSFDDGLYDPPPAFTFTYFGRPGSSKGLDILMAAVPSFFNKYPGTVMKLIISKSPRKIYKRIIRIINSNNISGNIRLLHDLDDETLKKELLGSSCVVIPSYSEGFCFAAAETIALGIPLLHSNLGALREVVSGKHIPMESQDAPGLFSALEKAIRDDWEEKPLKKFELQETTEQYIALYKSLISS